MQAPFGFLLTLGRKLHTLYEVYFVFCHIFTY